MRRAEFLAAERRGAEPRSESPFANLAQAQTGNERRFRSVRVALDRRTQAEHRQPEPFLPRLAGTREPRPARADHRPDCAHVRLVAGDLAACRDGLRLCVRRNRPHELRAARSHRHSGGAIPGPADPVRRRIHPVAQPEHRACVPHLPGAHGPAGGGDRCVVAVVHARTSERSDRRLLPACLPAVHRRVAECGAVLAPGGAHHVLGIQGRPGISRSDYLRRPAAQRAHTARHLEPAAAVRAHQRCDVATRCISCCCRRSWPLSLRPTGYGGSCRCFALVSVILLMYGNLSSRWEQMLVYVQRWFLVGSRW